MMTRFDPRKASGAVLVKPRSKLDLIAVRDTVATVQEWSEAQGLAGDQPAHRPSRDRAPPGWKEHLEVAAKARLSRPVVRPPAPEDLYA